MKSLSIIIPCRNEERYIGRCLDSVLRTTYPHDRLEVIVIDGQSEDATRAIVESYAARHPFIRLIDNPKKIAPAALNLGVSASKGEYIIRLDAHTEYPHDYFERLVDASIRLGAANVGAVCRTETMSKTPTANAIQNVLSDRFGVGNSSFRTGVSEIVEADTVPFGCFRRDTFERYGLFDERLIRNQDIEFNKRIARGGGKIYLIPDVTCTYFARETYAGLWYNNYQNGYWNILTPYYTRTLRSLSLRHFVPLLFVLGLIVPTLLSLLWAPFLWVGAAVLGLYLAAVGIRSAQIGKNTTWLRQIAAFAVLHFSYGFGSIGGIITILKKIPRQGQR